MHIKNVMIVKRGTSMLTLEKVFVVKCCQMLFNAKREIIYKAKEMKRRYSTVFVSYMFICLNFKCKLQKKQNKHLFTERVWISIDAVGSTLSN